VGAVPSAVPIQFLILLVSSWLGRHQSEAIEYLRAENRLVFQKSIEAYCTVFRS
jgi:hypothetical protein